MNPATLAAIDQFISTRAFKLIMALLLIAGILWFVYRRGKKDATITNAPLPTDNPNSPTGSQVINSNSAAIRELSMRLYNDMKGTNVLGRDIEAYQNLLLMSDTLFTGVYNDFNSLFFKESKETLTQWIKGENFWLTNGFTGAQLKDLLIARFAKLNLK
jgi:hypothetical protein